MADSQRKTANLFDATIEQGTITINGNLAADNRIRTKEYINIDSNYITLSWDSEQNTESYVMMYDANGDYVRGEGWITSPATKQIPSNVKKIRIIWRYVSQADILPSAVNSVMVVSGQTPLPYEPYGWLHSLRKLDTATDTLTTLPADLYADGQSATVGLVGNMVQTGTPTPQNPIQPSECGDMTANLFYTIMKQRNIDSSGKIITDVGDAYDLWIAKVEEGKTYTVSKVDGCYGFFATEPYGGAITIDGTRILSDVVTTFTVPTGANYVAIRFLKDSVSKMCNSGSTLLPYQPYGYKLGIKSANTTTPVYLGEVETTRQIKKYEFTGQETVYEYDANNGIYRFRLSELSIERLSNTDIIVSHFSKAISTAEIQDGQYSIGTNYIYLRITSITSGSVFKTYLQQQYAVGTPVTVWYVLANETTGIVNEPIRKIGDYADSITGITIPTITGKDTFDVLTSLKPSEVSLTYTGWHDASAKEWDGSQWQ